jgi:2-polyprenyl-3-methyl-5-hydroxy-6-metoxy-1,4-benzoquinol methylase
MIRKINFSQTEGLTKELEAIDDKIVSDKYLSDYFGTLPDLRTFCAKNRTGREDTVMMIVGGLALKPGARILDVGVGIGLTSMMLAEKGYTVSALEPSNKFCRIIEYGAKKYQLKISVYNCIAEVIDEIEDSFDAIVFNSSFHHCDDPALVLKNCYKRLNGGGAVALINENMLKFYKTKASYYRNLMENPIETGHYGGNEHAYHHGEYMGMLKDAGFRDIEAIPSDKYSGMASLKGSINNRDNELDRFAESIHAERKMGGIAKKIKTNAILTYNSMLVIICKNSVLRILVLPVLKKLSMVNIDYCGYKQ